MPHPPPAQGRRRKERFLADLPLRLWDSHHRLLDGQAMAHDLTLEGFGFETKSDVKAESRIHFDLRLPDGQKVSGAARVVWSRRSEWGTWAGASVSDLSRRDQRKLRKVIYGPGFDWVGLLDRSLRGGAIVVAFFVAQDLFTRHPQVLRVLPWLALAAFMGGLIYYYKSER